MGLDFWSTAFENFQKIGGKNDLTTDGLAFLKLLHHAFQQDNGHVCKFTVSGSVRTSMEEYVTKLTEKGGRLIVKQQYHGLKSYMFFWNAGAVEVDLGDAGNLSVNIAMLDEELANSINEMFKADLVTPTKQGHIFAIMRYGSSLQMQSIGFAGTPLETDNYNSKIIDDYNYIIKDLKSPLPSGRIAIFDGPPGTGKTYMVRALLLEVPTAMFVLVPPAMVSSLGGPELLPMLLQHKQSYAKNGPTVFILEDADACLAPRASDNMDSITSILNIGDGIFGSLFDIRIVATTNAKQAEMDTAVIRAGRLSKRVAVGRLDYEDANRIYSRLLPGQTLAVNADDGPSMKPRGKQNWSLAEIYRSARDSGWLPPDGKEPQEESDLVEKSDFVDYDDDDDDE